MGSCFGKVHSHHGVRYRVEDDNIELLRAGGSTESVGRTTSEEEHLSNGHLTDQPDAMQCVVKGNEAVEAEVGSLTNFTVHIVDAQGEPFKTFCTVKSELKSLLNDSIVHCSVTQAEAVGEYKVSYKPHIRGRHRLKLCVNSAEIQGSPFSVFVKYPPTLLGRPVRIIRGLGLPHAITITGNSEIVVSEWESNQISVFSKEGQKIREFGATGRNEGEFIYPWGVATDEEGSIYVADSFNNRIQKFTKEGGFVKAVGSLGKNLGQFNVPSAIRLSTDNKFYVCDTNNKRVQILNMDLEVISCFGSRGVTLGKFWTPQAIAFDSQGNLYIADNKNNTIQTFTADGEFISQFGGKGSKLGKLNGPVGISIDCNDWVYVTEWENSRVSVFDVSGGFLASFGNKGTKPGEFHRPSGIVVDEDGFVYVCDYDSRNGRIQVF